MSVGFVLDNETQVSNVDNFTSAEVGYLATYSDHDICAGTPSLWRSISFFVTSLDSCTVHWEIVDFSHGDHHSYHGVVFHFATCYG